MRVATPKNATIPFRAHAYLGLPKNFPSMQANAQHLATAVTILISASL